MRLYFIGSHATGKTTLCRYVSARYGLPMISEVARGVLAELETDFDALRSDIDLVNSYQDKVFAKQVAVEQVYAEKGGGFVSDRAFDNLAYAAEHSTNFARLFAEERFRSYMNWVSQGVVFFLRPHQSLLKEDGVRAGVSWESVLRIDGMIKLLLEMHEVQYLPIESVSMQERVRTVDFVVNRQASQPAVAANRAAARPAAEAAAAKESAPASAKPAGDENKEAGPKAAIVAAELVHTLTN